MMLQVELFKVQFKWAAVAGLQQPVAFGAVVIGHRVVGRRERARGSGEVASTAYRRKRGDDAEPFFWVKLNLLFYVELLLLLLLL